MNTIPCVILIDAEEHLGEGDHGPNWTKRPRYVARYKTALPFAPTIATRFGGLFPASADLCYTTANPDDEDDREFGFEPLSCFWCVELGAFIVTLGIQLLLPWESDPKKLPKMFPGWKFSLDKERSEGFDPAPNP